MLPPCGCSLDWAGAADSGLVTLISFEISNKCGFQAACVDLRRNPVVEN
jgi:hypothetical protein